MLQILKHRLFKSSFILFWGTIFTSFFTYLYTLAMARILGPAEYGNLASLLSIFYISGAPTAVIGTVSTRFTTFFEIKGELGKILGFWKYLSKISLILGFFLAASVLIFAPQISKFLNISQTLPFVPLSLALLVYFLLPVNRGILLGRFQFWPASFNGILEALLKFALALLLVLAGLQVLGAVAAVFLAATIALLISFVPLKEVFKSKVVTFSQSRQLLSYAGQVLAAVILTATLLNIDVVLVKHFFEAEPAGKYAALSVAGKIVFMLTAPVTGAMFPLISERFEKGEQHWKLLLGSILLILGISLSILAIYFLVPSLVIKILFGKEFLEVASYLGLFGLAILFYALLSAFVAYYLSIRQKLFLGPLLATVILEMVLLWLYHDSFVTVIKILILTFGLGFLSLLLIYLISKRQQLWAVLRNKDKFTSNGVR